MKLRVLYFASLREKLGTDGETFEVPADVATVQALREVLAARGGPWAALRDIPNLRAAVDQRMAAAQTPLAGATEVAFFPPVTGG